MNKKLSINLGIMAVAMVSMFVPILLPANAQNTTTDSLDVESVKSHLDDAKKAFDSGNNTEALKHLELAEDNLNIANDLLEGKSEQNNEEQNNEEQNNEEQNNEEQNNEEQNNEEQNNE